MRNHPGWVHLRSQGHAQLLASPFSPVPRWLQSYPSGLNPVHHRRHPHQTYLLPTLLRNLRPSCINLLHFFRLHLNSSIYPPFCFFLVSAKQMLLLRPKAEPPASTSIPSHTFVRPTPVFSTAYKAALPSDLHKYNKLLNKNVKPSFYPGPS